MFWQHGTVPGRGHRVPACPLSSTGPAGQCQDTQAIPPSLLASLFWGERGSSRSRAGRVCLACRPGDGGQPLLSEAVCTCPCHQQGEIKIYLYSGGFGHCRRGGEGCRVRQGGISGCQAPSWRVPWDWGALVSSRGEILVSLSSRWDLLPKSIANPSWWAHFRLPHPQGRGTQLGSPGSARWTSGAGLFSPWISLTRPRAPAGSDPLHPGASPGNPARRRSR